MALYNFQKRFVPKILSGEKRHTIRAKRARQTKPGEMLHLYTGLRQKGARLLMRVACTKVEEVQIYSSYNVSIDGVLLDFSERTLLAQRDGFNDFADMMFFWTGRLPFRGDIIHWQFKGKGSENSNGNGISAAVPADGMQQADRPAAPAAEVLLGRVPAERRPRNRRMARRNRPPVLCEHCKAELKRKAAQGN